MMNKGKKMSRVKAPGKAQMVIYSVQGADHGIRVRIEDENVWLSQKLIAELFQVDVRTVNEHIGNIFSEQELDEAAVIRNFRITAADGKSYNTHHYNLDAILAVGYRVRSSQGTQFRGWATQRLREYLIKGFTLDDERLRQGGGRARYFQELIQRVRDIRSSERMFYQKVTDIYATSIDYRVDAELTRQFFATVQNKMHFAVHGHTAAELITMRVSATQPLLGLTSWKGNYITIEDASIAKNFLTEREVNQLNLIVSLYLDFAELQASSGRLMKMADWVQKLDEFLKISEKQVLMGSGKVTAEQAQKKAQQEFIKYRKLEDKNYTSDFDREVRKILSAQKTEKNPKESMKRKRKE